MPNKYCPTVAKELWGWFLGGQKTPNLHDLLIYSTTILYDIVVWLREIFCSTQTIVNFGDQYISKCLNNLFLVTEWVNRISLANFSDLQSYARDQSAVSEFVFKRRRDHWIVN